MWVDFIGVFLGAFLGAILSVWWANRSYDRQAADQAFMRLRQGLRAMWQHSGYVHQVGGKSRLTFREWSDGLMSAADEISLVYWHSRRWTRRRKAVRLATSVLANTIGATRAEGAETTWLDLLREVGALEEALYGNALDGLYATDEEE